MLTAYRCNIFTKYAQEFLYFGLFSLCFALLWNRYIFFPLLRLPFGMYTTVQLETDYYVRKMHVSFHIHKFQCEPFARFSVGRNIRNLIDSWYSPWINLFSTLNTQSALRWVKFHLKIKYHQEYIHSLFKGEKKKNFSIDKKMSSWKKNREKRIKMKEEKTSCCYWFSKMNMKMALFKRDGSHDTSRSTKIPTTFGEKDVDAWRTYIRTHSCTLKLDDWNFCARNGRKKKKKQRNL